jgi:small subunit ribosomal protein S6
VREYELTVVFDLAVAETGGADAAPDLVTTFVEARKGTVLKHDHWGRRRMAYPINRAIDADYVVSRVEMEPEEVNPLEAAMRIDERIYRHLIVRADELPAPPPPREPRRMPAEQQEGAEAPAAAPPAAAVTAEAPAVVAPSPESLQTNIEDAAEAGGETAEPVVPPTAEPEAAPAVAAAGDADAPVNEGSSPTELDATGDIEATEAPAAAVESAPTEADAPATAGTEDEAGIVPQKGNDSSE